ncbi:MAG TPA: ABC transporter permease [Solirubrobacteraceae bacterium]|nr:ABC transporter permease [Solirubrobacteraceae bacterium]
MSTVEAVEARSGARRGRRTRRLRATLAPYGLVLPGGLWLAIFFVAPMVAMLLLSLQTGNIISGFQQTLHVATYENVVRTYHTELVRSLVYGLIVSAVTIVLAYPMAYWIAFHGGSRKSTYLFLTLLPFFVSFLIRTLSWNFLLADNGLILGQLKSWGIVSQDFHVLATPFAVIAGLTYNFFPFMLLPLYVALERIDKSMVEAATDLYAGRTQRFLRIVLPLSIPGVFAGVLLVFVPASSDFINASILGGTNTTMIGNVIQTEYFTNNDYPSASALAFVLMAILLIGIFAYARALGTKDVLEASAG